MVQGGGGGGGSGGRAVFGYSGGGGSRGDGSYQPFFGRHRRSGEGGHAGSSQGMSSQGQDTYSSPHPVSHLLFPLSIT